MISIRLNGQEMDDDTCILVDKNTGELSMFSSDERIDTETHIKELNSETSDTRVTVEIYDNSTVTDFDEELQKKYNELLLKHEKLKRNYMDLCKTVFKGGV